MSSKLNTYDVPSIVTLLYGEIHGMIANMLSCQLKQMSTPSQIVHTTCISPVDVHHALAALQEANICRCEKGIVVLLPLPQRLKLFLNANQPLLL